LVLLEEMSRAFDGRVRLALGTRDSMLKETIAAAGDGILVTERRQERLRPLLEHFPRTKVRRRRRILRGRRDERRKLTSAGLVRLVGKRRIVCGHDVVRHRRVATVADDEPDGKNRNLLRELPPREERFRHLLFSGG